MVVMNWPPRMNFKLHARINRSDAETIRHALHQLAAKGFVRKEGDEFLVEAEMGRSRELRLTLAAFILRP